MDHNARSAQSMCTDMVHGPFLHEVFMHPDAFLKASGVLFHPKLYFLAYKRGRMVLEFSESQVAAESLESRVKACKR